MKRIEWSPTVMTYIHIKDSSDSLRKIGDYWRECPKGEGKEMITRILIVAGLVLSCSFCWAEDLPEDTNKIKSLTAEQAAELVARGGPEVFFPGLFPDIKGGLFLPGLTSIDKDVARELAKAEELTLGLTSIDKDVANELVNTIGLALPDLTSIDKDVAQELGKFKGTLNLDGLTLINKDVAQELAKVKGSLYLGDLTSIDKDVAQELGKFKGTLSLNGLTSIDKNVAQELAKFKGELFLNGLTSIDKNILKILKSNPKIWLPHKYRDSKKQQRINTFKSILD